MSEAKSFTFTAEKNSTAGRAQWEMMSDAKFWYWDKETSDWPFAYAMDDARSATPLRPLRISTAMRTAVRTFDTLPGFPLRAHAASEWGDEYVRSLIDRGVHALHLTWMAQRTKAGQARPLMRAILDHVVRAGPTPLAPAHARCTALAYKLLDAQ